MRAYAEGAGESVTEAEFQNAMQSLIRKEMMERDGDGYRLAVAAFWVMDFAESVGLKWGLMEKA